MYGFTPEPDDREAATGRRPRRGRAGRAASCCRRTVASAAGSAPGTGTWARNRKTTRIPATNRSRRRMSGARKALSRLSITVRRLRLAGGFVRRGGAGRRRRSRPRRRPGPGVVPWPPWPARPWRPAASLPTAWRPARPCAAVRRLARFGAVLPAVLSTVLADVAGLGSRGVFAGLAAAACVGRPLRRRVGGCSAAGWSGGSGRRRQRLGGVRLGDRDRLGSGLVGALRGRGSPGSDGFGDALAAFPTPWAPPRARSASRSGPRAPGPSHRRPRSWPRRSC